jgi:hypothetical protein
MQTHRYLGLDLYKAFEGAAILGLLVLGGHAAQAGKPIKRAPDYVLVNGKIFTADATKPYAQALAIRGERIVSVGTSKEIGRLASPHTSLHRFGHRTDFFGYSIMACCKWYLRSLQGSPQHSPTVFT